ncbi:EAL domain-containing protein [Marinobacter sp. CHS3-4]|uniref:sensor domain-containing protein n=1 Tax=Marinobacter sp. CHS3-4 TaxID=3045174 RepID=UPI0024B594B0|nr:EAL domain-containing protein [Marinobacter sp. CHS3-4]MDI9246395.1 EAL domain-containing protein [Marinobacter sp. CHS3-4]
MDFSHTSAVTDDQAALLSEVARQISNGVIVTDEQGLITWINPGFETITGYRLSEVLGKKPGDFLQGEQTDPRTVEYIRQQVAENKSFTCEIINYHQKGHPYWVRTLYQPITLQSSGFKGFMAIQSDISAEKASQEELEYSLQFHRAILGTLYDAVVTTDLKGTIKSVNPALEEMFGYQDKELIGQPITKLMPQEMGQIHDGYMHEYAASKNHSSAIMGNLRAIQGVRADGSLLSLRAAVTETEFHSERLLVAAMYDITESESRQAELQGFRATLDNTLDCVFMIDAQSLQFFYVNEGASKHVGYSREEMLTMHPYEIQPNYPEERFRELTAPLVSGDVPSLNFETVHRHKKGFDIPVEVSLQYMTLTDELPRFIAIVRDISRQRKQQKAIEKLAYYDPLTNLPNRRLIREYISDCLQQSEASGCFGAVMLTDLDNFKTVNDTLGHRTGDNLLIEVSNRFVDIIGDKNAISRLGGDEFLIVFITSERDRRKAIESLTDLARQLLWAASKPTDALGSARPISTSIGIVLFNNASVTASDLMRMADIAMYDAKNKGKNSYSLFDGAMQKRLLEEQSLTVELNTALRVNEEIIPWFQPKVDQDGQITGFEALARWMHPYHGLMTPGSFIELAERQNLMGVLSDRILLQSCHCMSKWREKYEIDEMTVSVNISQSQLTMRDFPERVKQILAETGLPPEALVLEITESVVAENIQHSVLQMKQLIDQGITFSMDDFGTGYSSLSYLRELPISELKIDKSFVESLLHDEEGFSIVRSILNLADSLKLSVVAEGIETHEQWQALKNLGCGGFQGYFFSRPQPEEQVIESLQRLAE